MPSLKLHDEVSKIINISSTKEKTSTLYEFNNYDIHTIEDLLLLKPRRYDDTRKIINFSSIASKGIVNTFVNIISKQKTPGGLLKIVVEDLCDGSNVNYRLKRANLMCFGRGYLYSTLQIGNTYHLYSASAERKENYASILQISDFRISAANFENNKYHSAEFGKLTPLFLITKPKFNKKVIEYSSIAISELESDEYLSVLNYPYITSHNLLPLRDAFYLKLYPQSDEDIEQSRRTLAAFEIKRIYSASSSSVGNMENKELNGDELKFMTFQGFEWTESQKKASREIVSSLDAVHSTERLLEGEVGSGKTIVSFLASYHEILKHNQVMLMAPTEILSMQHYTNAVRAFRETSVKIAHISSSLRAKERTKLLEKLKQGDIDLLIGTQSLLADDVVFKSLSLAIIDEEQRFGTLQKEKVKEKGKIVHILYTTATPIPRSIKRLLSGKIDCSTLDVVPKGRLEVKTFLVSQKRRLEAYRTIAPEFEKGHCAYFIVPKIDDDNYEKKTISKLESELSNIFPSIPYAVVHSKIKDKEKNEILQDFLIGKIKYLISTSVVEVGMDNPLATVIVIEDADVFGLSALHQLRGRVGRGKLQSWCFLIYRDKITENGKERLRILKDTTSGFKIAEKDLELRGEGDMEGIRQSGASGFSYFDIKKDEDLID